MKRGSELTKQEIMKMLLAPRPKAASTVAAERWSKPKKPEAVVADHDAADHAVIRMLQAEQFKREQYQALIDRVWQSNFDYQANLRQFAPPSFHKGPGDPDW